MTLFLIVLLGFVIVGAGVYAIYFLQNQRIQQNINILNTEMMQEDYQKNLAAYSSIGSNLEAYNRQYYEVTNLYFRVAEMDKVEAKNMDIIQANLPADVILTDFEYMDGYILLTGLADNYYSPLDLIASLSDAKTFTFVDITKITQLDLTTTSFANEEIADAKQYSFTIKGSLETDYAVKVSKMLDGATPTPLTAVTSNTYAVGDSYQIEGITTFTNLESTYSLSRVKINDVLIDDPAIFNAIKQSDALSGTVTSAVDIVLYYTLTSTNGGGQG